MVIHTTLHITIAPPRATANTSPGALYGVMHICAIQKAPQDVLTAARGSAIHALVV
jgi:hypothetical protein